MHIQEQFELQLAIIKELAEFDHSFLSPEGVQHFTSPFGFKGTTYRAKANPREFKGLTLNEGMVEAEGQDADRVATEIANHVGVSYPDMEGKGSRLRAACHAVEKYLRIQLSKF